MKRGLPIRWIGALAGVLLLSACSAISRAAPSTEVNGQAANIVRPTFPPTFTPLPTSTLPSTATSQPVLEPSATVTLTLPPPTLVPITPIIRLSPSPTPTWTPAVAGGPASTAIIPSTASPAQIACEGVNLLINPDFEAGQHAQSGDSVQAPDGWIAFWKEGVPVEHDPANQDGYRRPDIRVISSAPPFNNPNRVQSGLQALYISGGSRVFDAGVFQQVRIPAAGEIVCLRGFAHAWSSQSDDPFSSTLVTEDDRRNANFLLGIDPTGGISPWSRSVIWGEVGHLYDTYQPIPTLRVRAEQATVTVFVRGYTLWRFAHNDLFFDNIALTRSTP